MDLNELLGFSHIAIQCHDNPDADAIAAGFGLYSFFQAGGKEVVLFYGGDNIVGKPNLVNMLALFSIPLVHVPDHRQWPGLLITVDCQFGAGNVAPMSASEIAVIDHHIPECAPPERHDIQPHLGSCSTQVWQLLAQAGFNPSQLGKERAKALQTALYYGLFMDTSGLAEVRHPLDRDLRDNPNVDERAIKILKNSYLSLDDLALTARALTNLHFNEEGEFALVPVEPCDSNLLGYISDLVMQVDSVQVAVVYASVPGGIKYSVRTVMRETRASDIAAWLAEDGLGSGGGHTEKAGGWISMQNLSWLWPGMTTEDYFEKRLRDYRAAYDLHDPRAYTPSACALPFEEARPFSKKAQRLAYVPAEHLPSSRTRLIIRMLEGDIDLEIGPDTHLMIGLRGEIYPITRTMFEQRYRPVEGPAPRLSPYPPMVLDKASGTRIPLDSLAKACFGGGGERVLAIRLKKGLKLFTLWDRENYIKGESGDWLVWPESDPRDLYIVTAALFGELYEQTRLQENDQKDFTGVSVSSLKGVRRYRKIPTLVSVHFAERDGFLETREGTAFYSRGDAILTGGAGERWPVRRSFFHELYQPVPPVQIGENGRYRAHQAEVRAICLDTPFAVSLHGNTRLHGNPGDWLVEYRDGSHGIVAGELFPTLYEERKG